MEIVLGKIIDIKEDGGVLIGACLMAGTSVLNNAEKPML